MSNGYKLKENQEEIRARVEYIYRREERVNKEGQRKCKIAKRAEKTQCEKSCRKEVRKEREHGKEAKRG